MSERIDDGGPAFPAIYEYNAHGDRHAVPLTSGMSLRDYFAAQAMAGHVTHEAPDKLAAWAYIMADAMLRARAR